MRSKAHLAVGMATAMTVMMPETAGEAIPVVFGAASGCVICDIDAEGASEKPDASRGRILCVIIAGLALLTDYLRGAEFLRTALIHWPYLWFAGLAGFLITCSFASVSSHRGFSHSLIAMALETGSLWLMFPGAAAPFAIAFASHILLDLLNKRPVRLLYPLKKGFCFRLFYADRLADKIFAAAGIIWIIIVIYRCAAAS